MKVLAELSVIPMGTEASVSAYVAACQRVLREAGLKTQLHAQGTNVEGEWDAVMNAVRRCHEVVHEMGAPRVYTTLKIGTRTDKDQSLEDRVSSVESRL